MDQLSTSISPFLEVLDSRSYAIVALAAVVAAVLVVALSGSATKSKAGVPIRARASGCNATILFVGPMASGKTSFFGRVSHASCLRKDSESDCFNS